MIAFGHNLSVPFIDLAEKDECLPVLIFREAHELITPLENILSFHQNQGRNVKLSTNLTFYKNTNFQKWCFDVENVISFFWEQGSNFVEFSADKNADNVLSQYWLLHTFLPIYLSIENKFELIHAGSVEIDARPVLFIAPSYGGKSTLTDYFIQQGHIMISDDRVALQEKDSEILATSSYPYHRPYRKMEDLGLKVLKFMKKSKKLHIIYVLEEVGPSDKISFVRLRGMETFKALQYNFDFTLPLNKARSFELIAKIASLVPIYRISIPWDLNRLDEVYEKICAHSNNKENL